MSGRMKPRKRRRPQEKEMLFIGVDALSGEGGMVMVPASSWQKGVYVFRLTGEHTQAVKVLK